MLRGGFASALSPAPALSNPPFPGPQKPLWRGVAGGRRGAQAQGLHSARGSGQLLDLRLSRGGWCAHLGAVKVPLVDGWLYPRVPRPAQDP